MSLNHKVPVSELTRICSNDPFDFKSTADLEPLDSIIGQRRAIEAIDFALNMKSPGYHIFISGPEGTGKNTITGDILSGYAKERETPPDLCMVNNFEDESCPKVFEMPTGSAVFFSRRMTQFIETLKIRLPKAFEDQAFQDRRAEVKNEFARQNEKILSRVEAEAEKLSIGIVKAEKGFQPVPLINGKPVLPEEYQSLPPEQTSRFESGLNKVHQMMDTALKEVRKLNVEMQEALNTLISEIAESLVAEEMELIFSSFIDRTQVKTFLEDINKDLKENLPVLLQYWITDQSSRENTTDSSVFLESRYQVNVLMDRRGEKGAPVIFELNPTFQNLFGKIEHVPASGGTASDFTMVQAGSLLRANKGYLVMEVESLIRNPMVWETLKNTLQSGKLVIQDLPDQPGYFSTSLKPEPIPVDLKVILLGDYDVFRALQGADPKFNKIFKVRADFDHEVELTQDTLVLYARFIARVCASKQLLPFSPCGVTSVVEYGNRIVEDKQRLTLRFGQILSLLEEADYWARKEKAAIIEKVYVEKALEQYRFRHNLYEEKVQIRYDDATILIDVKGEVVGQVNALAVYQVGEIAFGRPSRITAESYMGKPGIINVEHEAELSGQTHDKGVMIVAGYLGRMFAQNYPLSVSISITFEQSYSGIDGDSASSTELYAVLSSLSGYPIRQGIAVTGSVNQKGEIQAIGGVNEKVEGFFDICQKNGLTGDQGVMVPRSNVRNLMVKKEVVTAVEQGKFHIYEVAAIEQGIEILTGVEAGISDAEHNFPIGTVFGAVQAKLKKFHDNCLLYKR